MVIYPRHYHHHQQQQAAVAGVVAGAVVEVVVVIANLSTCTCPSGHVPYCPEKFPNPRHLTVTVIAFGTGRHCQ